MQISGISGSSSAWAVRELFPPPQKGAQSAPGAGQSMPSSGGAAACTGMGGAQMSSAMMSSLMGLQSSQPSLSDLATKMISSLDTDGDGKVSAAEAQAGGATKAADAFSALDSDGDGSLTADELESSLQSMPPPPGGGHGPHGAHGHGGAPSSSDMASTVLGQLDADDDSSLSLTEITNALGVESSSISDKFSGLDTDGDGKLSLSELTSAIDQYLKTSAASFAQSGADSIGAASA